MSSKIYFIIKLCGGFMKKIGILLTLLLGIMSFSKAKTSEYTLTVKPYLAVEGAMAFYTQGGMNVTPEIVGGLELKIKDNEKSLLPKEKIKNSKFLENSEYSGGFGVRYGANIVDAKNAAISHQITGYFLAEYDYLVKEDLKVYVGAKAGLGFEKLQNMHFANANNSTAGLAVIANLEGGVKYKNATFGLNAESFNTYIGKKFYPEFKFGASIGYEIDAFEF